jgi:hypothetical protein
VKTCTRWSLVVGTAVAVAAASPVSASAAAPAAPAVSPAASAAPSAAPSVAPLPSGPSAQLDAAASATGVERSPAHDAVRRAIDGSQYVCAATQIDAYVDSLLAGLDRAEMRFLLSSGVLDFPTYDALLYGTSTDPGYALPREYRQDLAGSFRAAQRFWDVPSADIQLLSMHGPTVLQDSARLTRLLVALTGWSQAEATAYAEAVVTTVAAIPELKGGNNGIFTLNAFAFTADGETDPLIAGLPDKIVFGDGILGFFEFAGLTDVGPRAVLAHEFAHHVQFERDLFDSPLTGAEATRRTELMADAMATYFATHSRGLSLNAKRVAQAQQSFAEVGDCAFASDGHHGTPLQRERASTWGADLASSAQKQGKILPSLTVAQLFEAELPRLVAPDAGA